MDVIKIIYPPIIGGVIGAITALTVEWYRNRLRSLARYHESQFSLYNTLWSPLYDLKLAGDSLWETANASNLRRFREQLEKTKDIINRNTLLIEENHLEELKTLIQTFENYQFGKASLIEVPESPGYRQITQHEIEEMTRHNETIKQQYEDLIDEIARSLRKQLRRP